MKIYVWSFAQMYRDVRGIKDAFTTATTAKRFCFSVTVQLYILIFRVIERYTDIYEAWSKQLLPCLSSIEQAVNLRQAVTRRLCVSSFCKDVFKYICKDVFEYTTFKYNTFLHFCLVMNIPHICHGRHRRCPCKFFLDGVNFYRFNAKKLAIYCVDCQFTV